MKKFALLILFTIATVATAMAQQLNVLPLLSADSGQYDDQVSLTCTFPEGCAGGKYWINGGELQAQRYDGPIVIDYDCDLSVAGTDADGRIITDVVTHHYTINRVTPPSITASPREGVRTTSFYVTRMQWNHVGRVACDLSAFKTGGSRNGENVVWLTGPDGQLISGGDFNNLWVDGLNSYKIYIYKNYDQKLPGEYTLHVAGGIFTLDGHLYDDELQLHYVIAEGSAVPVFSPEEGTYKGSVSVSIDYPVDGTAFYKFYRLNGAKAKQYTAPITVSETTTIEAYGMDEDFSAQTSSAFATYTIVPADPAPEVIDAPTISRQGNSISISGPAGATLKYWTDHRMATARLYTAPFTVSANGVVSCVAYTDRAVSPTVSLSISDLPVDRGGRGEQVLLTPLAMETAHVRALSPDGRWAVGFVGSDTSSKGFIWDLESGDFQYASSIFINQLWSIDNDGTAYGWRTRTADVDESMTDDDFLWGAFKDGMWSETSRADVEERLLPHTPDGQLLSAPAGYPAPTAVSQSGEWAILGQAYRYNTKTGNVEHLVSMSDRYSSGNRPELLSCITDDGTIFGTYDGSSLASEKGVGLVRTNDGRWRDVADWLRDTKGIDLLDGYNLTSVRDVTGDGSAIVFHANPRGISSDDTFTRGLLLRIDVPVSHLAPVSVRAEQMSGRQLVKLTWKAPVTGAEGITAYNVVRDGQNIATLAADVTLFYDENVVSGRTYTYTLTATYADGTTSAASRQVSVACQLSDHLPVRNLAHRTVGLNGLCLTWDAPIVSLPKLQYFNEESESFAFGTGTWNAEFGIRIPASDMKTFEGQQIRTFQFLPAGPQKNYVLNLYRGDKGEAIKYDEEPFYSQRIDPASLNYGTVNTIELATPQALPDDADLYVGLYIESIGNSNMINISYEGFRSGYSDLCRIEGVHDQMVAMSQNSSQVTEVVVPIGIGVTSENDYNANIISHYAISDNGTPVASPAATRHTLEQLPEGRHTFSVTAVYRDGQASLPTELTVDLADNEAAYAAITPRASVNGDNSVSLAWDAPRDDDRSLIHWGDLNPAPGWPLAKGLQGFMAVSIYPVNMTADYADDYEISELFFCPTAEGVDYELALGDEEGNILAYIAPTDLRIGEINYVALPTPVSIDPSVTYQVVVNIPEVEQEVAALAYDSSGKWTNGFSNVLNYGAGITTLAEFVQITEHPNWLMGMVVRQKDARTLPVEGYYVSIDGAQQNATALTDTHYTSSPLADGRHTAAVNVVYANQKKVAGHAISFSIGADGLGHIAIDRTTGDHRSYDLQGRPCPERSMQSHNGSRGIVITDGRKSTANY